MHNTTKTILTVVFSPTFLFANITAEGAIYFIFAISISFIVLPLLKYFIINNIFGIENKKVLRFYLISFIEILVAVYVLDTYNDFLIVVYLATALVINALYYPKLPSKINFQFLIQLFGLTLSTSIFYSIMMILIYILVI